MEMLYFATREFTRETDRILKENNLGRAHHRVLYFVARNPGINVTALLDLLEITKQSLARAVQPLRTQNLLEQKEGEADRRHRLFYLTEEGKALEKHLTALQCDHLARAFRQAGADSVAGFRRVLKEMMPAASRNRFSASTDAGAHRHE